MCNMNLFYRFPVCSMALKKNEAIVRNKIKSVLESLLFFTYFDF